MHQVRAAVSPHQQRILRDAGTRYARQAADSLEQFTRERDGSRAAVACHRRIDIENEQPFRHESEIDIAEVRHRSQEQPRAGQEDQRYGHLRNHEHRPEPLSDVAGLSSGAKRRDAGGSRRLPGGRKAEQDRCRQRNQPDETQEARVDRDRNNEAGPVGRNQSKQRVGAHPRERDAGGAAECREHHALGQKLTNEPWLAHPERRRTSISRRRAAARASRRFAMLAQAMRSTKTTAPMRSWRGRANRARRLDRPLAAG